MAEQMTAPAEQATRNYYEGMFLVDSNRFSSDSDGISQGILHMIERAGGEIVVSRPWQEGKLAYAVKGQRRGTYFLTYFRMKPSGMAELERLTKLNESVLRHMFVVHPQSLFDAMVEALSTHDSSVSTLEEEPREDRRGGRRRPERHEEAETGEEEEGGEEE